MATLHMFGKLFTSTRGPLPNERDLRLDFFRGLALFSIFIDHIPGNIFAWFTLQAVMCSDAAEVFVFISGFTAGTVYSRTMDARGFSNSRNPSVPPCVAALRCQHRSVRNTYSDSFRTPPISSILRATSITSWERQFFSRSRAMRW